MNLVIMNTVQNLSNMFNQRKSKFSLFDEEIFTLVNSKNENGVQLADLIAGTLSYIYDDNKQSNVPKDIDYLKNTKS